MSVKRLPPNPRVFQVDGAPRSLAELLRRPGVFEESVLRSPFGFMAIHGGGLELMTDVIASTAAERAGASYYGVIHPDDVDHHLSSARYLADESATLDGFLRHVDVVVSIHGYGRHGSWTSLLLGGRNRELAVHIAGAVGPRLAGYQLVSDLHDIPPELRGLNAANPVNAPAGGGVQLELPPRVRGISPFSPPAGDDGFSAPTRALIEGLAEAALAWQAGGRISTPG
jgi:phage replication-related protein YjqB (UPF0714/DUF867 family)